MGVFLQGDDGRGSELESGREPKAAAPASCLLHTREASKPLAWAQTDLREDSRVTSQRCFLDPCPSSPAQQLPSVPVALLIHTSELACK